jgi:hypothetical protein
MIKMNLAALVAVAALSQAAFAQQQLPAPNAAQMRQACASDAQTLCATAQPGPEQHRCMMANMGRLSEGCRSAIQAQRSAAMAMRQACSGDIRQFCAGAQGPARMQCLRQNQDKLSHPCQSALSGGPAPQQ